MSHIRTKGITSADGIPISDEMLILLDHATSAAEAQKNRARLTEREWHTLQSTRASISEEFARIANTRSTFVPRRVR